MCELEVLIRGGRESIDFVPLAVETLGGWHTEAIDTIKAIALAQGSICLALLYTKHL